MAGADRATRDPAPPRSGDTPLDTAPDEGSAPLDYGLVSPLGLPVDARLPERMLAGSDSREYDLYFRITRDNPGLESWTRDCLRVQAEIVADLERSSLPADVRCDVLRGLLSIQGATLERWVTAVAAAAGEAGDQRDGPDERR
jgi:hypothetical protein